MSRRALVTGSSGQDGPYLVEYLLARNYQVHAQSRRADTALSLQDRSLHWQAIDICNLDALHTLIAEVSLASMTK